MKKPQQQKEEPIHTTSKAEFAATVTAFETPWMIAQGAVECHHVHGKDTLLATSAHHLGIVSFLT
jgi:hypothetical protein